MRRDEDVVLQSNSRAQALKDGVLVDVSEQARKTGFRTPVALTRAAWHEYVSVPSGIEGENEERRLHQVLTILDIVVDRVQPEMESELMFGFRRRWEKGLRSAARHVALKAQFSRDDMGSPCITLSLPEED